MVSTRRAQAALEQPEQARPAQQPTPPIEGAAEPRTRRTRRKATAEPDGPPAATAATTAPAGTKRRLRSAKVEEASPLRQLSTPPRTRAVKKRQVQRPPSPTPEPQSEEEEEQGVFFTDPKSFITPTCFLISQPSQSSQPVKPTREDLIAELAVANAKIHQLEHDLKSAHDHITDLTLERMQLRTENKKSGGPREKAITHGDASAYALLDHIVGAKNEALAHSKETYVNGIAEDLPLPSGESIEPAANEPIASPGPQTDSTPKASPEQNLATAQPNTPEPVTLLGKMSSLFKSFTGLSSKSSTPKSLKSLEARDPLTETLTPTPTPVGESRKTSKTPKTGRTKKTKRTTPKAHRNMIKAVSNSVEQSEKDKAETWAKDALAKLASSSTAPGDKRKQFQGAVLLKDLHNVPGRKPWQPEGTYALLDELYYDSDDEDEAIAPAWAVLYDMLADFENPRPAKKHKSSHEVTMDDDVPSLNESSGPSTAEFSPQPPINTRGHSSSLMDLRPRSSRAPAAMFEDDLVHQQGGNVFSELQGQSPPAQMSHEHGLRHNGHVSGSGTFRVPESDSEDEDVDVNGAPGSTNGVLPWTQQPPPPPVPAHASLPNPLTASPSVPAIQAEDDVSNPFAPGAQPMDEIERQRARLMKFTPAKPSRLRETHVPSPSLRSDAGNDTILGTPSVQVEGDGYDIPDAESLDLEPELLAAAESLAFSSPYKQQNANAYNLNVELTYDDDDYEMSEISD